MCYKTRWIERKWIESLESAIKIGQELQTCKKNLQKNSGGLHQPPLPGEGYLKPYNQRTSEKSE